MRITRVYTRTGDGGRTRLVGGAEVDKDDPRVEAYGTVDEVNAALGVARTLLGPADGALVPILDRVQNDLFDVGSELATPPDVRHPQQVALSDDDVARLEAWIDALNDGLPPLTDFVLPGGGPLGAALHVARTTCRRAERRVCTLARTADGTEPSLRYLNRLSDLLFVMSRHAAHARGIPETTWNQRRS